MSHHEHAHEEDRRQPEGVAEADERYSAVDAEDVAEDAKELFEQHHEGPPLTGNPEADPS